MGERSSVRDPRGQSPVWWRGSVGGLGGQGRVLWVLWAGGRGAKRPRISVIQPGLCRGVWRLPRWQQGRALPAPPQAPEASRGKAGGEGDLVCWGSGCLLWDLLPHVCPPDAQIGPDRVNFGHLKGISL